MIPDEAVEAAAKEFYGTAWDDVSTDDLKYALDQMRDTLKAAAPHMPRTITTAEDLDALPVQAVIRGKWLAEKWADEIGELWHVAGKGMRWDTEQLVQRGALPATVLHEPEPTP